MNGLMEAVQQADTIAIGGHVRPDGDCIGSCMGLYGYIKTNFPEKTVCVYLEEFPEAFSYLQDDNAFIKRESYDLFVALDCGDEERLGEARDVMRQAGCVANIDHHITNAKFGDVNYVQEASSTCEILCRLMEEEKITYDVACALYTGIIHDTGVFKHSNTTKTTMQIAGMLMEKGIPFGKIIDGSFYLKTYKQLQIMGRCLLESVRILNGRCLFSVVRKSVMDLYEAKPSDLDGVIDQMRTTEGIEVAILLDERQLEEYKVSMRSNEIVYVSAIASYFGGGGHVRAAGCSIKGSAYDVINNLTEHIEKQMEEAVRQGKK